MKVIKVIGIVQVDETKLTEEQRNNMTDYIQGALEKSMLDMTEPFSVQDNNFVVAEKNPSIFEAVCECCGTKFEKDEKHFTSVNEELKIVDVCYYCFDQDDLGMLRLCEDGVINYE